jgi:ubiquinone/menaquinone biosynthesis C-methylase UbiE
MAEGQGNAGRSRPQVSLKEDELVDVVGSYPTRGRAAPRVGLCSETGSARELTLTRLSFSKGGSRQRRPAGSFGRRLLARTWDRRVEHWDHQAATDLQLVIDAVLEVADVQAGTAVVDLGCGTGQLSLPMARAGANVLAVDLSSTMLERLQEKAEAAAVESVEGVVCPMELLDLPTGSVDLVVSSYALHHVRDRDKERLVANAARWLRPGGKLVLGDMMFGRGTTARDRAIIVSKLKILARRGPGGWWRLVKNVVRYTFRFQERPVSIETWKLYFERAGLVDVRTQLVVSEAAIVSGTKPEQN